MSHLPILCVAVGWAILDDLSFELHCWDCEDCTVDLSPILLRFSEPVLVILLVFFLDGFQIGETYSNLGRTRLA